MSTRAKPEHIPDEVDILLEIDQLRAENTQLKTKVSAHEATIAGLQGEKMTFEKAVAVRVASLGIGVSAGATAAPHASATDAMAAHMAQVNWAQKFRK